MLAATAGTAIWLARPRLTGDPAWRATITPLASIIGSGFLVAAPVLVAVVGPWAPAAMAGIVALAYGVGWVIRLNIRHVEPVIDRSDVHPVAHDLERLSSMALGAAYVVSVAFYIRLLASFLIRPVLGESELAARLVATGVLAVIGWVGWRRGLGGLESVEIVAVTLKLSIIAGIIAGLAWYDASHLSTAVDAYTASPPSRPPLEVARMLAGLLLLVQGFETSRYLGHRYDATTRISTMRRAQLVSGAIYVAFIALIVPLSSSFPARVNETAIIDALVVVTPVLAVLVVVAAIASQLSAGVADTAGAGGMLVEALRTLRSPRLGYAVTVALAIALIWSTNVFGIITLASRAFALYYALQAGVAIAAGVKRGTPASLTTRQLIGVAAIGMALVFVVAAGEPVG